LNPSKIIPAISVILPVYNGGVFLMPSLKSVLGQSFKDFELLVVDDCSTDESWEYINSIKDTRLTIYKNKENKGLFYNLNFLIKESRGSLIKLWAQDDIMYPHCLEAFVSFHKKHPGIGFSYSGREIIDEHGLVKKSGFTDNTPAIVTTDLHACISFYTGSIAGNIANVCISRSALSEVGLFNEEMKISADFDMWVRLAKDHDTGFISDKLIQLRDHEGQLSRKENSYILHVIEDMMVYRNLLGYVNPAIRKKGKAILRNNKFVFYYTLMLKAFLKGKFKTAFVYYKELYAVDNFLRLTVAFIKVKIAGRKSPDFLFSAEKEVYNTKANTNS
jgi:glycosyltransferase involved in cell wall biosynthesis